MASSGTVARAKFFISRSRERLWVKPFVACILSVAALLAAKASDRAGLSQVTSLISAESVEILLSVMASSMLVIAVFAVTSMLSAYASASSVASPRSFPLVIADDMSQNALSVFIGSFIFSIVSLTAVKSDYLGTAGRFALFVLTAVVFAFVVLTFVRWVDRIARLGLLGTVIDKVEKAASDAIKERRASPLLNACPMTSSQSGGEAVYASEIGYVQRVDVDVLQSFAEDVDGRVLVMALPGTFAAPGRAIAYVIGESGGLAETDVGRVAKAFRIGSVRQFDHDPRFGLVVLSEIAGRALSPAVNDPGTAIDIIGRLVRLFVLWCEPSDADEPEECKYDRVEVPELSVRDMFDDGFAAIARDGAGAVEVMVRLQKAFKSLSSVGDAAMRTAALHHARLALTRAEKALDLPEEVELIRELADFGNGHPNP